MSEFLEAMERANVEASKPRWTGTFRDFLRLFEIGDYKNLEILSHKRIENMIMSHGTERQEVFGRSRTRYNFFEDRLFGLEETLDSVMAYIHSSARKTETSRRMLLLWGPPSSGKSDMVALIKAGLEKYSRTHDGAVFAIAGSMMHENPFLLVPEHLRQEFETNYNIQIEGKLSPHSQWRLDNDYKGQFMDFPVEQIYLSEAQRVGIGTWLPQDNKSQDQSELVGGIDFAKIQEYGDESDPRTYVLNGELNVANRGMMEFIEGLKADERFLRVLLTATQERSIKAPRFGLISVDTLILIHSNEEEFKNFMAEKKFEAYHDRMVMIRVPYNLGVKNEVRIYEKLLSKSNISNVSISPHTLTAAAMFAIMTRLQPPADSDLSMIQKMRLYDGQHVKGHKSQQVLEMRKLAPREGMTGVSPRFVIDQISAAISNAAEDRRYFVTALDVLRQMHKGLASRDAFTKEEKTRYSDYLDVARGEFNELLRNDIQKAFFLSFEDEARALCENYLEQIELHLSGEKRKDPVSGEEIELDQKLMEKIENHLDITSSGRDDFRNEILRFFGNAARKGQKVDYSQHSALREAVQKQLFEERQGSIRMTVSTRNPDAEGLRRMNEVIDRMVKHQGYTAEAANELLKYATAHLFDK